MSNKVKTFFYWVSILPPIYNFIKTCCTSIYVGYMNALQEIEEKKMREDFINTLK